MVGEVGDDRCRSLLDWVPLGVLDRSVLKIKAHVLEVFIPDRLDTRGVQTSQVNKAQQSSCSCRPPPANARSSGLFGALSRR